MKEYKILDNAIQGIRRSESTKRANRYKEPVLCRNYGKNEHVNVFLPILDWTNDDVAEFVKAERIECHPLYYDEWGEFHPERRLGCIGCPLASIKNRMAEFRQYPKFIKPFCLAADKFLKNKPHTKSAQRYKDGYELFLSTFSHSDADFREQINTLFGEVSAKERLEEMFDIKL